jgi:hypothetical protein
VSPLRFATAVQIRHRYAMSREYCRVILSHTERVKSFLFSGPFFSVLIEKNQIRA